MEKGDAVKAAMTGIDEPTKAAMAGTARAIMIQGTMSGAGKSLLAAGLCRIFRQDSSRLSRVRVQSTLQP